MCTMSGCQGLNCVKCWIIKGSTVDNVGLSRGQLWIMLDCQLCTYNVGLSRAQLWIMLDCQGLNCVRIMLDCQGLNCG